MRRWFIALLALHCLVSVSLFASAATLDAAPADVVSQAFDAGHDEDATDTSEPSGNAVSELPEFLAPALPALVASVPTPAPREITPARHLSPTLAGPQRPPKTQAFA
ncbi:MAG TPA: hypothetical protein VGE47_02900 [Burkholderiaceae bacterium]